MNKIERITNESTVGKKNDDDFCLKLMELRIKPAPLLEVWINQIYTMDNYESGALKYIESMN